MLLFMQTGIRRNVYEHVNWCVFVCVCVYVCIFNTIKCKYIFAEVIDIQQRYPCAVERERNRRRVRRKEGLERQIRRVLCVSTHTQTHTHTHTHTHRVYTCSILTYSAALVRSKTHISSYEDTYVAV